MYVSQCSHTMVATIARVPGAPPLQISWSPEEWANEDRSTLSLEGGGEEGDGLFNHAHFMKNVARVQHENFPPHFLYREHGHR
jgi:hypothetical protein